MFSMESGATHILALRCALQDTAGRNAGTASVIPIIPKSKSQREPRITLASRTQFTAKLVHYRQEKQAGIGLFEIISRPAYLASGG